MLTLYKPHTKQREIHNAINTGGQKYYVVSIGRQFGKTLLAENQLLYWAINYSGCKIGWISPVYSQCKKVYGEIFKAIANSPYISESNKSDLIITFANGSTIQFFSAERYDNIRGNTFDYLICDEFAFIKKEAWTEVLKATVLVKGKKVLIISTPKGKNHFFDLFNQAKENEAYYSISGTSFDNPKIDPSELEDARRNLPEHVFRQEYLAEFLDGGSAVFKNVNECIKLANQTSNCYAGIDLGRADDYTVLTIINERNEVFYCERWRHMEWSSIISNLVKVLNVYKPKTLIETNGAQDAIFEQIRNAVAYNKNQIQSFVTTAKSKQSIIEDLIVSFENKDITIPDNIDLIDELNYFTYEYNLKTRQIHYSAPSGLHDDMVMSLAICLRAKKEMLSSGVYTIR
jgi:phage FluMu gp28-like protein